MSSVIEQELEAVDLEDVPVDATTDTEPAAPAPPIAEGAAPAAPTDDGSVPKDDDVIIGGVRVDRFGRMHRADGTVMSRAEQDARATGASSPTAPVAPVPVVQNEPFVPNVYGKPMADLFPGALKSPTGDLYFPKTQAGRVEQLLARGMRHDEFRQQSAEAKSQLDQMTRRTAAEAKALETTLLVHVSTPEALANLAARVQQVGPELAHKELSLAIREAALAVNHEFGAGRARAPEGGNTTPLDRNDAGETFEEYWRDMLATPAYHGMPADLQQQVRSLLANVPLFAQDKATGEWFLNEPAGDAVWAMAQATMARERSIMAATESNAGRRPNTTAPSRIPPSAARPSPIGNGTPTPAKKPAREFANPFDAIRYADTSGD